MKYETIIISDLHLGSKSSRTKDILKFLDSIECNTLILNGDIIDGWALKRGSKWKSKDTKVIRKILKMSEKGTKIVWVMGNHDDFLEPFIGLKIDNIQIVDEFKYVGKNDKKYYIVHGDKLDVFSSKFKLIAKIGSIGYDFAIWLNLIYNKYREWRGLPYFSLSNILKQNIKKAISFIEDFENNAIRLSENKECDVIICGHIHHPKINEKYMNSGDWCENCSFLVEDFDGNWSALYFH